MKNPRPDRAAPARSSSPHDGPLPPPADFAAYERAYPGTAERLLVMSESLQAAKLNQSKFEQRTRFFVAIAAQLFMYGLVGCAVYLAMNNKPLEAFLAGLAPIAVTIYANIRKQPGDPNDQNP